MGKAGLISKITVTCEICGTEISCRIPLRVNHRAGFDCPLCGSKLEDNFASALRKAITYNKSGMDLDDCQNEMGISFEF